MFGLILSFVLYLMKKIIPFLALILAAASVANAQTTNTPRTNFEICATVADAPLLKAMSVIGTLNNQINYPVEIRVEVLTNLVSSNVIYGVSLRTRVQPKQTEVDYIDYDELDGFIRGIQFISQSDHNVTTFDNFEAAYQTRCGLSIVKVSNGTKLTIVMKSGGSLATHNQMASFVLDDLGRYLTAAKAKLDSLGGGGP
jgi:hypothetical protein